MSTTTNYTTTVFNSTSYVASSVVRKVDLYIMGMFNFSSDQAQKTSPTLAVETGGKVCAGMVKLAQKVVQTLLTFDVVYETADWGNSLSSLLLNGVGHQIQSDFSSFMNSALGRVTDQIQGQETDDMPDDERLQDVTMTDWSFDRPNGRLTASLQVVTRLNTVMPIVVPISVVP